MEGQRINVNYVFTVYCVILTQRTLVLSPQFTILVRARGTAQLFVRVYDESSSSCSDGGDVEG